MSKSIYVNLAVQNIPAATEFYRKIGCEQNPAFSDEKASSMAWSDNITFHLLTEQFFATFSPKPISDSSKSTEVLLTLTLDSRESVDTIVSEAARAGGKADPRAPVDLGWLYNRAFEDLDGHVFEAVWMDMAAMKDKQEMAVL